MQEVDSEDEWQSLMEATDQENDPEAVLQMFDDDTFIAKLNSRVQLSISQVLDGMLEGASRLRTVLRVVTNLVTIKWYVVYLTFLTHQLNILHIFMLHN